MQWCVRPLIPFWTLSHEPLSNIRDKSFRFVTNKRPLGITGAWGMERGRGHLACVPVTVYWPLSPQISLLGITSDDKKRTEYLRINIKESVWVMFLYLVCISVASSRAQYHCIYQQDISLYFPAISSGNYVHTCHWCTSQDTKLALLSFAGFFSFMFYSSQTCSTKEYESL